MAALVALAAGGPILAALALAALAVAMPLGALAGVTAALNRNRYPDTLIILVLVAGLSIPNFAIATLLVYLLSLKLNLPLGALDRSRTPFLSG